MQGLQHAATRARERERARARERQQAEYNDYASLSTFVMTYILLRRISAHRTRLWEEARRNMQEGDTGKERTAHALKRWVSLDVCYVLLRKVFMRLQAFRSADSLDAQVIARAEMDGIGIDWAAAGRIDGWVQE